MQSEDLGDPRLYEDEAIREQAARLQVNVNNLHARIESCGTISKATEHRISRLAYKSEDMAELALEIYRDNPL